MAGSQKEFELLFKLKAALGPSFNNTFKGAINTNNQLRDSLKNVNSLQSKIDGFQKQTTAIEKNRQKLDGLNTSHEKIASSIEKHSKNISELENKIAETGDSTGELTIQLQKEKEALEKSTERLERNESQIQQTTAKIQEQERQLNSYADELRKAGVNTDNLEEANSRLQRSYDRLQSSQQTLQKINEKQQQVQKSITGTKLELAATVTAIGYVAKKIYDGPVQSAQEYETAMAKVATIADTQAVPLEAMSQQIMQLSNQTGIAATAIADDVYNAISAGQSTGDAVNFVTNSTKLAKAGFAESSQTLDVLTTILNAYGMSADKVGAVSDMLIQTQNKGKVTVGELSSVMGKVIPTANSNGVALEQLTASYAIMTSKGIAAAETTTYLNSMMNELGKSGTKTDKLLRSATGSSFKELMASGKSLGEVLQIVQDEASKSGLSLADMFGSAEAGKAAVTLLSNGVDGFNSSVQDMVNSVGATDSAFAIMDQNTESKMAKAKNSIANLGIVLGQNLLPIVGDLADKVAVVVTKVAEFAQANPKLVQTVLKVVAGLAALKVGMLGTKLVSLSAENGILSLAGKLVGLRAGFIENAATSAGFMATLKGAGSSILSYFGNVKGALGSVGSAIGNMFSGNALVGRVAGMLGGVKSTLFSGISGIAGKAAGVFASAGSTMLGYLLRPFTAIGGRLGGMLSGLGGVIARSPLGTIGKFIGAGFSKATTLIAPLGNAIKTVLGPIGNLAKTALGPLGGIAGKILPVVGVFTAIITVIKMVKDHLQEIRDFIQKTFGDEALAVFNKIVDVIENIGKTIKGVFSDGNIGAARDKIQEMFGDKGTAVFDTLVNVLDRVKNTFSTLMGFMLENVVPTAEKLLNVIISQVIPGIVSFIQAAAPTIMAIIQNIADFIGEIIPVIGSFIAGLMPVIEEIIDIISTYVLPIISELFSLICSTVLPAISAAVQAILPVVQNVLQTLLPAIQTALTTIWNIVSPIIQGILAAVQAAMPTIQAVVTAVVNAISGVISGLATVLNGIITFITGVFTGNWRQAWDGIKSIFSGIWEAIKSVAKGAVNGIISIVNGIIGGLNKLQIPDWVPGVGGKGINIPLIPMLAKGSTNTPDTFIAGEAGPELITNAPGRTVFTADQTKNILAAQNAAATTAAAVAPTATTPTAQTVNNYNAAPEVAPGAGSGGSTKNVTINNNPTLVINGDKPDNLDAKLEENNRKLLRDVEDLLDEKEDKERRQKYD